MGDLPSDISANAGKPAMHDDHAMIEACLSGDARAWSRFVDRFGRVVYAVPHRLGLPHDGCDDVFQAVFLIILRELPKLRQRGSLAKWIITIAHHESYRWLKRSKMARDESRDLAERQREDDADPPLSQVVRLEQLQVIYEGLDQLGGKCRDLLYALFLDVSHPSYKDISQRLGIPVGAIGPTRNRCLAKLLELIGDQLEPND